MLDPEILHNDMPPSPTPQLLPKGVVVMVQNHDELRCFDEDALNPKPPVTYEEGLHFDNLNTQ